MNKEKLADDYTLEQLRVRSEKINYRQIPVNEAMAIKPDFIAGFDAALLKMSDKEQFLEAVFEERNAFCNEIHKQHWDTKMRTAAESLLIIYDQMKERLIQFTKNTNNG